MTVVYHPLLLLLWGAHCNVQGITNADLSRYVLKYAMKEEPSGTLNLDTSAAEALGLGDLSDVRLKMFTAQILTRPLSTTEAVLHNLGISLVSCSVKVLSISTQPPKARMSIITPSHRCHVMSPVIKYTLRPHILEEVTFFDYMRNYEAKDHVLRKISLQKVSEAPKEYYDGMSPARVIYHSDQVVSFTDFHPTYNPEAFFYNVRFLHDNIPVSDLATHTGLISSSSTIHR
jgi:hypothetical protein